MKLATLFSGIGSPEQGAIRVYDEVETVFACEFDKYARHSYKANYDIEDKHFHKDVHNLDATQYKDQVDILVGGSPCQSFSIAGLRKGTEEDRGQLIYQYIRVVKECLPEIIVYENVKGIMSIDNGNTIKEFVQALRDVGYHCHYGVVNTKDYGVPQNRERLFLVGFLDAELYHKFHFADKQPLAKRLKDILEDDVDEKYYLNRELNDTYTSQANTIHNIDKVSPTLCAFTHGYAGGYISDINRINRTLRVGGGSSTSDKHCFDLVAEPKIQVVGNIYKSGHNAGDIFDTNGIVGAITCSGTRPSEKNVAPKIESKCRIRKLTPRECFRLQDFTDDFKFVVSNSQLYKQAGNSMSVNILEMIFNQIEKAKNGETVGLF